MEQLRDTNAGVGVQIAEKLFVFINMHEDNINVQEDYLRLNKVVWKWRERRDSNPHTVG